MRRGLASRALAVIGLFASAATTHAINLPVEYLVRETELKLAVAGTPITFELHDEPTCAVPEHTVTMEIDLIHVMERLKNFQPKGGPKRTKQVRLQHTLFGVVDPPSPLYLKVTGTGIAPFIDECRLQPSMEAGGGTSLPCASQVGNEVVFSGCNVSIRNGAGSTAATNGLGNLIVGYNENDGSADRTGSHNVVVGQQHTYTSSAGLIAGKSNSAHAANTMMAGELNSAHADMSSITGGTLNETFGTHASVTGGRSNEAGGAYSSVSGGGNNAADGDGSSVAGGDGNDATGNHSSIGGGTGNGTSGDFSSVAGGRGNGAHGTASYVSGGRSNVASGPDSFVGGGNGNSARSTATAVLGGQCNVAGVGPKQTGCIGLPANQAATVTGGFQNLASGNHSSVNGGNDNTASGGSSVVGGGNTITQANGFGWSAGSAGAVVSGRFVSP